MLESIHHDDSIYSKLVFWLNNLLTHASKYVKRRTQNIYRHVNHSIQKPYRKPAELPRHGDILGLRARRPAVSRIAETGLVFG